MALVNRDSVLKKILNSFSSTTAPAGYEILSYKRNRGITVMEIDNETFQVREHGYIEEVFTVKRKDLEKILKAIIKREFPRSRKLRVYRVSGPEDLGKERKKL